MEVHFTPEQEARLAQIARTAGADDEELVKDAALRLLEEDASGKASRRPTAVNSSKRMKWRRASNRCSARKCASAGHPPLHWSSTSLADRLRPGT
jgi:hypothetical protein